MDVDFLKKVVQTVLMLLHFTLVVLLFGIYHGELMIHLASFETVALPPEIIKPEHCSGRPGKTTNSDLKDGTSLEEGSTELEKERKNVIMQNFAKAIWNVLKQYKEKLEVIIGADMLFALPFPFPLALFKFVGADETLEIKSTKLHAHRWLKIRFRFSIEPSPMKRKGV